MLAPSFQELLIEAGCDEAGRGPLAGSVFGAAVILPKGFHHPLLNDSKQMSERNRNLLREIIEREAVAFAVAEVTAERIDRINILNAAMEAMSEAVFGLDPQPELIVVVGNRFHTTLEIPYRCIVGGDALYSNIAAASVLAKTYRDEAMTRLAAKYPQYGWERNKGYPTREHRLAVAKYGLTPYHRRSFNCGNDELSLFEE